MGFNAIGEGHGILNLRRRNTGVIEIRYGDDKMKDSYCVSIIITHKFLLWSYNIGKKYLKSCINSLEKGSEIYLDVSSQTNTLHWNYLQEKHLILFFNATHITNTWSKTGI